MRAKHASIPLLAVLLVVIVPPAGLVWIQPGWGKTMPQ